MLRLQPQRTGLEQRQFLYASTRGNTALPHKAHDAPVRIKQAHACISCASRQTVESAADADQAQGKPAGCKTLGARLDQPHEQPIPITLTLRTHRTLGARLDQPHGQPDLRPHKERIRQPRGAAAAPALLNAPHTLERLPHSCLSERIKAHASCVLLHALPAPV